MNNWCNVSLNRFSVQEIFKKSTQKKQICVIIMNFYNNFTRIPINNVIIR